MRVGSLVKFAGRMETMVSGLERRHISGMNS